ncbi:MAG: A/G-specific adenine glycosylase [Deferrisomatales bacterium]
MPSSRLPPPGVSATHLHRMQEAVLGLHAWYRTHARELPWRATRDPYAIWVSEAMLQQTRVATVLPYYSRWIQELPTVGRLAGAAEQAVLRLWEGLGYYSRARNLHRAARVVVAEHGGAIPDDPHAFGRLPGVGPYTVAAVMSLAFDRDLAAVDGNVRRVLGRLTARRSPGSPAEHVRADRALAGALLPSGTARVHNQAMMELGALVCTPKGPRCGNCPLRAPCAARRTGTPEAFPPRLRRPASPHYDVAVGIVVDGGRVFLDRRPYGGLLGGLWEFPGGKVASGESAEEALRRELREEFAMEVQIVEALAPVRHAYSHFRVTLHPFRCRFLAMDPRAGEGNPWAWVLPEELPNYPMPRANRKVIDQLSDRLA